MKITFSDKKPKNKNIALVSLSFGEDTRVLVLPGGQKSLSIGTGRVGKFSRRKLVILARKIITIAKSNKIKKLAISFSDFIFEGWNIGSGEVAEILAVNFEMANFEFVRYKTPPRYGWDFIEEIMIIGKITKEIKSSFGKGQIIGAEVNNCRILANTPGGEMTPKILAQEAARAVKNTGVKVKILGLEEIKRLKMGGIMGVARGSVEKPKFIIMEYRGSGKAKPIVLVGKGVTFDSGGLNLKPSDNMLDMHMDKSGAAAVIYAIILAAKLGVKKNIIGLIPAVENMPSGASYHPGDVLKTMSGKTIEVINTDAEGRIILAEALTYAKRYKPRLVIDVATLTGAAVVALGQRASAIFTKDKKLERLVQRLGEQSGDYVWPLPLWNEYKEEIKGAFGDISNTGKTKYGGAITAAIFLYQFAKYYPWLHIDMAPRMTSMKGEYLAKGAAGAPVRLLIKLLERY